MWNLYRMLITIILWLLKIRRHIPINSGILCMHTDKRGQTIKKTKIWLNLRSIILYEVFRKDTVYTPFIYTNYIWINEIYMKFWDGRNSLQWQACVILVSRNTPDFKWTLAKVSCWNYPYIGFSVAKTDVLKLSLILNHILLKLI